MSLGPKYSNAVKGIEDLLLTDKESFKVHLETDGQGRVLELKVLDQALVDKRDEYNKIKGIRDLNIEQRGSRKDIGNVTAIGDRYEWRETSVAGAVVLGETTGVEKIASDMFLKDSMNNTIGLTKEGVSVAEKMADVLVKYGEERGAFSKEIQKGIGAPFASWLRSLGLDVDFKIWGKSSHETRRNLIRSALVKKAQEIATDKTYRDDKERARAIVGMAHLGFIALTKDTKSEVVKSHKDIQEEIEKKEQDSTWAYRMGMMGGTD